MPLHTLYSLQWREIKSILLLPEMDKFVKNLHRSTRYQEKASLWRPQKTIWLQPLISTNKDRLNHVLELECEMKQIYHTNSEKNIISKKSNVNTHCISHTTCTMYWSFMYKHNHIYDCKGSRHNRIDWDGDVIVTVVHNSLSYAALCMWYSETASIKTLQL